MIILIVFLTWAKSGDKRHNSGCGAILNISETLIFVNILDIVNKRTRVLECMIFKNKEKTITSLLFLSFYRSKLVSIDTYVLLLFYIIFFV